MVRKDILQDRKIVCGVTGGIAAYKTAELVSDMAQRGADVTVIMTESALRFVTPLTFQTLSHNPVITSLWEDRDPSKPIHISIAETAELIVIAPATANVIGKIASGLADDMLTCTVMACSAPVIIAPAMNDIMYNNRFVQRNIRELKKAGMVFVGPEKGRLASGKVGWGRMSDPANILRVIEDALKKTR
ncbi:MAG: bifunctional phosphopantothenoylcysteine decarboxylase/phosphopantothenate--cysteine ligase CoaBC [Planctomycetota bacterium]